MHRLNTILGIGLGVLTLGSGIGLVLIIIGLDPAASTSNLVLFYLDLFVLVFSITFVIGYFLRQMFGARELAHKHLRQTARQSAWFGLLASVGFILLSQNFFTWWSALLFVCCLAFLESYFLFK